MQSDGDIWHCMGNRPDNMRIWIYNLILIFICYNINKSNKWNSRQLNTAVIALSERTSLSASAITYPFLFIIYVFLFSSILYYLLLWPRSLFLITGIIRCRKGSNIDVIIYDKAVMCRCQLAMRLARPLSGRRIR